MLLDQDPCVILENEFVKPGKGQAFNRVKLRNLKTGRVLDKTFRSGETVPAAEVVEVMLQYLYNDGELWHLMDPESYEQYTASGEVMQDCKQWLKGEELCPVILWNGAILSVSAPNFVTLQVSDTDPGVRGDTVSGGSKAATLETGATVRLPLFIEPGEPVRIDTRSGAYMGRGKD